MSVTAEPEKLAMLVMALGQPVVNALLCLLFLVLVARPAVRRLGRPRLVKDVTVETLARLPEPGLPRPSSPARGRRTGPDRPRTPARAAGAARPLPEAPRRRTPPRIESDPRLERDKNLARKLFEANADRAIILLKIWLNQEA